MIRPCFSARKTGIVLACTGGVRTLSSSALALLLLSCATETVPVPEGCEIRVLRSSVTISFEARLRIVVLLDERTPLPGDVRDRFDAIASRLRARDPDGDGVPNFEELLEIELVVRETSFEEPLDQLVAPHVFGSFYGEHALLAVVLVTSGDVPAGYPELAPDVVALHGDGSLFTLGVIAGVPPDLVGDPDFFAFADVLDDPRMAEGVEHACASDDVAAAPARHATRLLREVDREGAMRFLASICDPSWDSLAGAMLVGVWTAPAPSGSCVPRELPVLSDGNAACTVSEELHPDDPIPCHDRPGRLRDPSAPDDPLRCVIRRLLPSEEEPGWYYDGADPCGPIRFSGVRLAGGSTVRLECVTDNGECGE